MLILRLNCDAALANLSTRTSLSVALCDIRALSSAKNNPLMTIRLVLASFQLCLIEQVGFLPSLDVYSFRGHVLGVLIEGDNGVLKRLAVEMEIRQL